MGQNNKLRTKYKNFQPIKVSDLEGLLKEFSDNSEVLYFKLVVDKPKSIVIKESNKKDGE